MSHHSLKLLTREIDTFIAEVEATPDHLLWECPPGISNSIGTLAVHVAGNLNHFIGAVLGHTGYERDRPREFAVRDLPGSQVVEELQAARDTVQAVLPGLGEADLSAPYPLEMIPLSTDLFLHHLCAHAALHVGQAGYLRRILTGDATSVGVTPIAALAT